MISEDYISPQNCSRWTIAIFPASNGKYLFSVAEGGARPMTPDKPCKSVDAARKAAVSFIEETVSDVIQDLGLHPIRR